MTISAFFRTNQPAESQRVDSPGDCEVSSQTELRLGAGDRLGLLTQTGGLPALPAVRALENASFEGPHIERHRVSGIDHEGPSTEVRETVINAFPALPAIIEY